MLLCFIILIINARRVLTRPFESVGPTRCVLLPLRYYYRRYAADTLTTERHAADTLEIMVLFLIHLKIAGCCIPANTRRWPNACLMLPNFADRGPALTDHSCLLVKQWPWRPHRGRGLLYSSYPKKSTCFNMAVTQSDLDPKLRKMPITI